MRDDVFERDVRIARSATSHDYEEFVRKGTANSAPQTMNRRPVIKTGMNKLRMLMID